MKNTLLLSFLFLFVAQCTFSSITIDSDFLRNYYHMGGTLLFDSKGNLNYLWVEVNLTKKDPYSGHQHPLSYKFKFKKTDLSGKILCNTRILGELGPCFVNLSTNGVYDSKNNLFCLWNLCIRSDVTSKAAIEMNPCYSLLVKIDSLGAMATNPCRVLPFQGNMNLTVDQQDTVWGVGMTPGSQVFGLYLARLFPNPQKKYTKIYGGIWRGKNINEVMRYNKTSTGFGLATPGLNRNILGFTINSTNQFILLDRMNTGGKSDFNNLLVGYIINKNGDLLRNPLEISIDEAAFIVVPSHNLPDLQDISLKKVFTEGTRLVNYGKDKIYAVVVYNENIYIIHLSEDGKPIKSEKQKIVKPLKLPKKWKPSLRLWTYLTKDTTLFYIFGIDEEANFYWETVTVR